MAEYREPGVRLTVKNTVLGQVQDAMVQMYPLIIGTGAKKIKAVVAMTRSSATTDIFPYTAVNSIVTVSSRKTGGTTWVSTTDYTFTQNENNITWITGHGPAVGDIYYVTLYYNIDASQYIINEIASFDDITNLYGEDIQSGEAADASTNLKPINRLVLAAQIQARIGGFPFYMQQVQINTGDAVSANDYKIALDTYASKVSGIGRIIPTDTVTGLDDVILSHIEDMSSVDEKKERTAALSKYYASDSARPTSFTGDNGVLSSIGGYAAGIKNRRVFTCYPDRAKYVFSDESIRVVDGPFVLAAINALSYEGAIQESITNKGFSVFTELVGVDMTRVQMNQLAAKGVLILTQDAAGAIIKIRHQLSTDISDIQSREISILNIQDYCTKYYRASCEGYIGELITPDLIQKVSGTIMSSSDALKKNGIIVNATNPVVSQNASSPDTIDVSLSVLPPYPCNYINITMTIE